MKTALYILVAALAGGILGSLTRSSPTPPPSSDKSEGSTLKSIAGRPSGGRPKSIYEWNEQDPKAAEAYVRGLPESEELYRAVSDAWIVWEEGYVQRALDWYAAQTDEVRTEIIEGNPDFTTLHDPGGVLRWAIGKRRESTPEALAEPLNEGSTMPTGDWLDHSIHSALDEWLKRDEAAARDWLFNEAGSELRDELLADLGYSHSDYPPSTADMLLNLHRYSVLELMSEISDPDLRKRSLRQYMSYQNAFTMQERLDASDLPPVVRADLQEMIDSDQAGGGRNAWSEEPELAEPEEPAGPIGAPDDPFDF